MVNDPKQPPLGKQERKLIELVQMIIYLTQSKHCKKMNRNLGNLNEAALYLCLSYGLGDYCGNIFAHCTVDLRMVLIFLQYLLIISKSEW